MLARGDALQADWMSHPQSGLFSRSGFDWPKRGDCHSRNTSSVTDIVG
jgi:hypothetical protein